MLGALAAFGNAGASVKRCGSDGAGGADCIERVALERRLTAVLAVLFTR